MDFLVNIMSSMPLWLLAWLPTIFFGVVVIFGVLKGMIRGYRKSMVLLIKSMIALSITLLLYLILFVWHPESFDERFIGIFNTFFGDGRFQSILGFSIEYTSITQIALSMANDMVSNMGDHFLTFWPEEIVAAYIAAVAEIFLRLIVFTIFLVIYFILNRIVLWIIYLIFFREGKRRRKINRLYEEGLVDRPYKKKRIGGGIIGGLAATVKSLVYLSFFAMFSHIITGGNFNSNGIQNQSDRDVSPEMMAITNFYNFFHMSGSTGIMNLFTNPNTMPFFMFFADYVASGRVDIEGEDSQYVLLREELAAITNITHILWTHIVENDLFDIGDEDAELDFSEVLTLLLQDENFEDVIIDAFDRFSNTTVINGLARHTLDSLFKGFAYSSDNPLVELLFGGESPLIYTDAIFNGENFAIVINITLRTFRLLDDIAYNFSDIPNIDISELLEGLSNNVDEVVDLINELLRLSFLNNIDISDRLNEAIADVLADVFEDSFNNFGTQILHYIQFIHPTEGIRGGELGRIIDLAGELLTSGILNYALEPQENIETIINILITSENGQISLISKLFEQSELAHIMLSNLLMNFELGDDISIIMPDVVLTNFNDSDFLIISQTEIITVINALSQLLTRVSIEELQQDPLRVILDLLKYEMDLVLDLFDSLLLQATFANVIVTMAGDFLDIHSNLIFVDQEGNINQDILNIWIDTPATTGELNNLVNALLKLDLIDLVIEILDNEDADLDIVDTILDLLG